MTSKPVPTTIAQEAAARAERLHFSFRVWSREDSERGCRFLVGLPRATMRSGFFGWLSNAVINTWGRQTRLGTALLSRLSIIDGVEPGVDNDMPHLLIVHVKPDYPGCSPYWSELMKGLPRDICVSIEETVMMNSRPSQRLAEYLRRLF